MPLICEVAGYHLNSTSLLPFMMSICWDRIIPDFFIPVRVGWRAGIATAAEQER
jgi:hypothetical protein